MLIRDIFPKEKIKKIAKERVLGIRPYKTKRAKYFNIGYRIFIGAILIFLILFSFIGFSFETFGEKEQKAEFYSLKCSNSSEGATHESSKEGWQNPINAQGKPEVLASGSIESFYEGNSAIYKGGIGDLLCEGFHETNTKQEHETDTKSEHETDTKLSRTVLNSDFDNVDNADLLVNSLTPDISGDSFNISGNSWNTFESAKIYFSFAIDNNPLINTNYKPKDTNNTPLINTNAELNDTNNSDGLVGSANADISGDSSNISDLLVDSDIDTKIVIWYSLDGSADSPQDGQTWYSLDKISSYPLSNALNGGYFSYEAPFLKSWEDVKNLKIKFEGVIGGETQVIAYLDSVWIEVGYQGKKEEEDKKFEMKALKKDWQANETPTFEIVSKGKEENFVEKIIDETSSIFEEPSTPKIEAKLDRPNAEELLLREGEDFSAETHSPTKITVFKPKDFRPGLHKLKIDFEKDGKTYNLEEDFTWGVLAINVNKSIYLPDERVYIQMAVLRDDGHTICDASLKLEIRNTKSETKILTTADGTIKYSGKCGANNATDVPDYFAYYELSEATQRETDAKLERETDAKPEIGEYQMKLTNLDNGYEITDSFEVKESVPFDVERIGPTRIYPPTNYEMTLKIKVNQDFSGQVVESVPASFEIINPLINTDNTPLTDTNNKLKDTNVSVDSSDISGVSRIIWQVDWKMGNTYELRYQFDAPDVSPDLHLIGPLEFYE